MTPPIIRPRDKRSTAASRQFVQEAAEELLRAEQVRSEAMRWIARTPADPLKALDALTAYRAGQDAVGQALAKYSAALRLAGLSAYALARANRSRTATVAARIDSHPEARLIRYARGCDIKKQGDRYTIQPRQSHIATVIEEL